MPHTCKLNELPQSYESDDGLSIYASAKPLRRGLAILAATRSVFSVTFLCSSLTPGNIACTVCGAQMHRPLLEQHLKPLERHLNPLGSYHNTSVSLVFETSQWQTRALSHRRNSPPSLLCSYLCLRQLNIRTLLVQSTHRFDHILRHLLHRP